MVICYNPSTIGDLHVSSISTLSVAGSNTVCHVSYTCWELNYDLYHCLMLGLCVCVGLQLAVQQFLKLSFLVCMSIPNTLVIT